MVRELERTDLTSCSELAVNTSCEEGIEDIMAGTGLLSLTPIIKLVEEMGLEVTYAFEDLVFVEHSAFLFQFFTSQKIALYFNKDCPDDDASQLEQQVINSGAKKELTIMRKGRFSISQKEGEENLELLFFEED